MLTYVINTSENKIFDSGLLFDLAGYNKIRWMHCPLNRIQKCAEEISDRQNILGADRFRIAVIVDFYSFDRIRMPYGRHGFGMEQGVDISLYMPYIEIYMLDHVIATLEKRELCPADFEIYYVHNEKCERYEVFENAEHQLHQIMTGYLPKEAEPATAESLPAPTTEEDESLPEEGPAYQAFSLYCSPGVTLDFFLKDYPYGDDALSFSAFWRACRQRWAIKNHMRKHYYLTAYGGGASRTALDILALSLYLIRMYEREEAVEDEGDMEVLHLDANVLREVLENAWGKVNAAKLVAKKNETTYFALEQQAPFDREKLAEPPLPVEKAIAKERAALPYEVQHPKMGGEDMFREIDAMINCPPGELQKKNAAEFNKIINEYLRNRDKTRESDVEAEFQSLKASGFLSMTDHCPSKEEYEHSTEEKQKDISALFEKTLSAEYIVVDYSEQQKKAEQAIADYRHAKTCLRTNVICDVVLLLLALGSVLGPYAAMQLASFMVNNVAAVFLALNMAVLFGGLFIASLLLQIIPHARKLKKAKRTLLSCYLYCCAGERYSFSAIRRRYEKDLIEIEHARYELRQLKRVYQANIEKEKNATLHHTMLEKLEDCIGGILNQLDVVPTKDQVDSIDNEFDLSKPIRARENKVYHIFSIETIEKMFPQKGSD